MIFLPKYSYFPVQIHLFEILRMKFSGALCFELK